MYERNMLVHSTEQHVSFLCRNREYVCDFYYNVSMPFAIIMSDGVCFQRGDMVNYMICLYAIQMIALFVRNVYKWRLCAYEECFN